MVMLATNWSSANVCCCLTEANGIVLLELCPDIPHRLSQSIIGNWWLDNIMSASLCLCDLQPGTQQQNIITEFEIPTLSVMSEKNVGRVNTVFRVLTQVLNYSNPVVFQYPYSSPQWCIFGQYVQNIHGWINYMLLNTQKILQSLEGAS